ncbi:MAG: phage holin family protein [Acidobacteriota bacterium]
MKGFILRTSITALGLWVAASIVPGMRIDGVVPLCLAAILLGMANALVRPILVVLTFPVTLLSLGLFLLVINALMLSLVASLMKEFSLDGFWVALLGSIVVSLTSWFASSFVGPKGRVEPLTARRRTRTEAH